MSIATQRLRPATTDSHPTRGALAAWGAQIALAAIFLFAGAMKFVMPAEDMTKDIDWPIWFLRFIGVAEIAGAAGLVLPGLTGIQRRLTPLAAAGLIVIMIGAVISTAVAISLVAALWPFGVGAALAAVLYARRGWLTA